MNDQIRLFKRTIAQWRAINPPLTTFALINLVGALVTLVLIFAVPTQVIGEPAWLKPFKFFASSFVLTATLPFIIREIQDRFPRSANWITWITVTTMALELIPISIQAGRGVRSHFNLGTPFDAAMFGIMGVAIVVFFVSMCFLTFRLFQLRSESSQGMLWGFRLGMILFLIGSATGWKMTTPTGDQLSQAQQGVEVTYYGAHTVGAEDGAEGLPLVGWAKRAGDLRVAHFVGMHAMQILPLFVFLLGFFGIRERKKVQSAFLLSAGLFLFYAGTLVQALNGASVIEYERTSNLIYMFSLFPLGLLGVNLMLSKETISAGARNKAKVA